MAKRKKRKTGRMPKGLRDYWNKKQRKNKKATRKGHKMAKRKGRKHSRKGSRKHRRGGGGGGGSILAIAGLPSKDKAMDIAAAGVYGFLEGKAKADANFMMNKIPRPIVQLGYSGGTALALYLANKYLLKNKWVGHLANGAAAVALYQMGKQGSPFADVNIAGDDDVAGFIDDNDIGALAAEGDFVGDDGDDIGDDGDDADLVEGDDVEGIPTMGISGDDDE